MNKVFQEDQYQSVSSNEARKHTKGDLSEAAPRALLTDGDGPQSAANQYMAT